MRPLDRCAQESPSAPSAGPLHSAACRTVEGRRARTGSLGRNMSAFMPDSPLKAGSSWPASSMRFPNSPGGSPRAMRPPIHFARGSICCQRRVECGHPTTTHFELARALLADGKHLLVEKPMTESAEQARNWFSSLNAQGCVFAGGSHRAVSTRCSGTCKQARPTPVHRGAPPVLVHRAQHGHWRGAGLDDPTTWMSCWPLFRRPWSA